MNKVVSFIAHFFDRRIYVFIVLFVALFAFDMLAISQTWYFYYKWIDIPVHFFGGFFLGGLFFYIVFSNPKSKKFLKIPRTPRNVFTTTVLLVLLTGGAWEVIEFVLGRTVMSPAYVPDTILDLVAGTLGGYFFYLLYKKIRELVRAELMQ